MRWFIVSLSCLLVRCIMRLRYKVKVKGIKQIKKKFLNKDVGTLILPNHPAHIDPILLSIYLWPKFRLHPIVVEYIYRQGGINFVMKGVQAIAMPNFDTSLNEIKLKKAKAAIQKIIQGVKKKENYLIYPAGRLKHTGKEILGGASATHTILQACPNANVVLVRTTGLWGSSFSRAYTGRSPDFKAMVIRGIKYCLKAFLFFLPRRKILIEMQIADESFPRHGTRLEINKYLEQWYNKYPTKEGCAAVEPINTVSYSPFTEKFLKVQHKDQKKLDKGREFASKLEQNVYMELAKISKMPESNIRSNMDLAMDLGLDSLDIAEVVTFLSVNYDIPAIHPEDIETVQDVLEIAEGTKALQRKPVEETSLNAWPEDKKRPKPFLPEGKTIQEAFLIACDKMKKHSAVGDDVSGILTYKKLKLAALVLTQEIKKYPGNHIAILLPASVGAYLVILATLLANKVPVMLNWTLGPRYLNHMMQVTHSEHVISSWKFLEKLSNVEFGHLTKKIHYLEDIKKQISKKKKLAGLFKSFKSTKGLIKALGLDKISENDTAVVLFTSGTESNPKGVPLSHKNLLSNQRAALKCVDLQADDIFYGVLPPFHSFGFSLVGILPILAGLKVAYYPDPTDGYALAEGISRWKASWICIAPSFLRGLLQAASKEELKSIKVFVTGAEKTSKEIFEKVKSLDGKQIIEGYGITECSPVVSLNKVGAEPKGVGQIIQGVEICTVDPETDTPLEKGKEGEICIKGDNIFSGYLAEDKNPFIEIDNEKWYRSGDLGYVDKDNNLFLSGRLKRFAKVAGEMVSLGGIEEVITDELTQRTKKTYEGPIVAIVADESFSGRPLLVLFTTEEIDKQEVNLILKEAGFSRLVKITDVKKVDEIPLMGTGKIDFRYLQTMIE